MRLGTPPRGTPVEEAPNPEWPTTGHQIPERRCITSGLDRHPATNVYITTRDGVRLAVSDYGSREADQTVVFLHGLCLSRVSWMHQIDHLLRRYDGAVRVISYDHRGHGRSDQAPMGSYRIEQLADDLAQVLTARQVTGALTLAGHSMGGMSALCYLARSSAERPVEPQGLALVASAAGNLGERGLGRFLATPATGMLARLIDHTPARTIRILTGPLRAALDRRHLGVRPGQATLAAVTAAALATTPLPTAVGFLPSLQSYDQYKTLESIRADTVVISGGLDVLTPPAHSRDLAARIPRATHVHLPAGGHMLPYEAPDMVNAAIQRVISPSKATLCVPATPLPA